MTTPQARRDAALKAMEKHTITQARACRLVSVDPKTVRREPTPDSPEVRAKMREIAEQRRRFGYRRIGMMLEREGIVMNHKKLRRLYGEEGLGDQRLDSALVGHGVGELGRGSSGVLLGLLGSAGHGRHQRLERFDIVRKGRNGGFHGGE